MVYYLVKIVVTAALVVLVSEIAKRSSFLGALLASLPLVSVLAVCWLYFETGDVAKIRAFSLSVFWLALPSLAFFLALPALLRHGWSFFPAIATAIAATAACYGLLVLTLTRFGIEL